MSENRNMVKIEIPASITVRDLAGRIKTSPIEVIKKLMTNGVMANINQQIDFDTAAIVVSEMGYEAIPEAREEEKPKETGSKPEWRLIIEAEDPSKLITRAPVVTILGHVDHGKTTLLDAIRDTNVAGGEAGGITQSISAYQVEHNGRPITFLDTPGHAAFTAMRARGAQGADVVVLVVAANDGVMPQTKEAIAHAKAAQVPIVVALNKIDRPDANPDFVKKQLAEAGLVSDEWDGDTIVVPVSAKQKTGLEDLLEAILLVADSKEIKANPNGKVIGSVIEAELDKSKGTIATLLIQNGTLQMGDVVVAGDAHGKIKAMFDFRGRKIRKGGPSMPVAVLGLSDVPHAGDLFRVVDSEKTAREMVANFKTEHIKVVNTPKATLEELFEKFQAGDVQELSLIVKADVQGSLEPLISSLNDLSKGKIKINVLYAETGNIGENDILLASASKAIVVGFNVQADPNARRLAENEGVSIRLYDIIYRLIEDVEKALKGMLQPEYKEAQIGMANIIAVFKVSKYGNIAGAKVMQGEIHRNAKVKIMRGEKQIYDGEISSLKHEKDDVKEIRQGFECGMSFKNFADFQVGDQVICYELQRVGVA